MRRTAAELPANDWTAAKAHEMPLPPAHTRTWSNERSSSAACPYGPSTSTRKLSPVDELLSMWSRRERVKPVFTLTRNVIASPDAPLLGALAIVNGCDSRGRTAGKRRKTCCPARQVMLVGTVILNVSDETTTIVAVCQVGLLSSIHPRRHATPVRKRMIVAIQYALWRQLRLATALTRCPGAGSRARRAHRGRRAP